MLGKEGRLRNELIDAISKHGKSSESRNRDQQPSDGGYQRLIDSRSEFCSSSGPLALRHLLKRHNNTDDRAKQPDHR